MTDNITSQNTEPSFWNTLYVHVKGVGVQNTLYVHVKGVGLQKLDLPF